ncbi:hypothetical protein Tco_0038973 [Tanacetum coccineum]
MLEDTIQLEPTAVSTISQEYLWSLPPNMDLFNLIRAPNPTKVKIGTRPRVAHEVPLLTVTASRVIEIEEPAAATETEDQVQGIVASEVPPPENVTTTGVAPETDLGEEVAAMGPVVSAKTTYKLFSMLNAPWSTCDQKFKVGIVSPDRSIHNTSAHNSGLPDIHTSQTVITHNAAYQADDLDAYDSDGDELNSAKITLMANLSRNGSDALTESNDVSQSETEITSDSNIIPYSQYLSEAQQETVQNSNSSAQQDVMILSMFEQLTTQVTHCTNVNLEYKNANQVLTTELDRYKEEVKDLKEMQI